jgi:hypothetical protein
MEVKRLRDEREEILDKIKRWRRFNSQSNPGAVKELRDLQKELLGVERKLRWVSTAIDRNTGIIVKSDAGDESSQPRLVLRT